MKILRSIGAVLYKWWMAFARLLALVNTSILLTLVYGLLIGPLWVVMKLRREDMLDRGLSEQPSYWKEKAPLSDEPERNRRQF
jgi:Saxitoxin biosynthesis operon protein SxtJ